MKLFLRNKETHIFIFRLRGQRQAKSLYKGGQNTRVKSVNLVSSS